MLSPMSHLDKRSLMIPCPSSNVVWYIIQQIRRETIWNQHTDTIQLYIEMPLSITWINKYSCSLHTIMQETLYFCALHMNISCCCCYKCFQESQGNSIELFTRLIPDTEHVDDEEEEVVKTRSCSCHLPQRLWTTSISSEKKMFECWE